MSEQTDTVMGVESPLYLHYDFTAGRAASRFLHKLKQGQLVGQRCSKCRNVYVPPRGSCARCGLPTEEEVPLSDKGTVQSFTIVHIPIPGNPLKPPFVVANVVPDGANVSFIHLVSGCDNDDVRIGMRVQAQWKPKEQWDYAMDNIAYFKPLDEPDMAHEEIGRRKDVE